MSSTDVLSARRNEGDGDIATFVIAIVYPRIGHFLIGTGGTCALTGGFDSLEALLFMSQWLRCRGFCELNLLRKFCR